MSRYSNQNEPGELIKTIRDDDLVFWEKFVEELLWPEKLENRFEKRSEEPRLPFTIRLNSNTNNYEVVETEHDINAATQERIRKSPSLYPKEEKLAVTKHQSASYIDPPSYRPAVFGWNRDRKTSLVGVTISPKDALYWMIMLYDRGTANRPKDFSTREKAQEYLDKNLLNGFYQTSLHDLAEKGKTQNSGHYNELLVGLKWNLDGTSKITIFSDNLESRLLAQLRAMHLKSRLEEKYPGVPITVPISFYISTELNTRDYTIMEQEKDLKDARGTHFVKYTSYVDAIEFFKTSTVNESCINNFHWIFMRLKKIRKSSANDFLIKIAQLPNFNRGVVMQELMRRDMIFFKLILEVIYEQPEPFHDIALDALRQLNLQEWKKFNLQQLTDTETIMIWKLMKEPGFGMLDAAYFSYNKIGDQIQKAIRLKQTPIFLEALNAVFLEEKKERDRDGKTTCDYLARAELKLSELRTISFILGKLGYAELRDSVIMFLPELQLMTIQDAQRFDDIPGLIKFYNRNLKNESYKAAFQDAMKQNPKLFCMLVFFCHDRSSLLHNELLSFFDQASKEIWINFFKQRDFILEDLNFILNLSRLAPSTQVRLALIEALRDPKLHIFSERSDAVKAFLLLIEMKLPESAELYDALCNDIKTDKSGIDKEGGHLGDNTWIDNFNHDPDLASKIFQVAESDPKMREALLSNFINKLSANPYTDTMVTLLNDIARFSNQQFKILWHASLNEDSLPDSLAVVFLVKLLDQLANSERSKEEYEQYKNEFSARIKECAERSHVIKTNILSFIELLSPNQFQALLILTTGKNKLTLCDTANELPCDHFENLKKIICAKMTVWLEPKLALQAEIKTSKVARVSNLFTNQNEQHQKIQAVKTLLLALPACDNAAALLAGLESCKNKMTKEDVKFLESCIDKVKNYQEPSVSPTAPGAI